MKKHLKSVILRLAGHTIVPLFAKKLSRTVTVLLYHDIDSNKFSRHIEYLCQHYNLISLREYASVLSGESDDDLPDNALIITVDDGWRGNYELLDTIKRYSVPMTIFLCAGLIGTNRKIWNYSIDREGQDRKLNVRLKASPVAEKNRLLKEYNGHFPEKEYSERTLLSVAEVEEMSPYVDFQSHGIFHEVLPMCNDEELDREVSESIGMLESVTNKEIYAFAFPYGRRNRHCIQKVIDSGYKLVRTSNIPGLNLSDSPVYELKAIGIGDNSTVLELSRAVLWSQVRFLYNFYISKFFCLKNV